MEQNREHRNKPKSPWSIHIGQSREKHKMEVKGPLQQMVLGELGSYMQKKETWSPIYTTHKNKFKVDESLKYKLWHHQSPRGEKIGREISGILFSNIFIHMSLRARDIRERRNKWELIKTQRFCAAKENSIKMKTRNNCMGKHICKWYHGQGFDLQNIYKTHMTPLQEDKQPI